MYWVFFAIIYSLLLLFMSTLTTPLERLVFMVQQHVVEIPGLSMASCYIVRKSGHALLYTLYFIVLLRMMKRRSIHFLWSFLVLCLIAVMDEWLQTLNPQRCGRWQDVVIDVSGACLWCGFAIINQRWIKNKL